MFLQLCQKTCAANANLCLKHKKFDEFGVKGLLSIFEISGSASKEIKEPHAALEPLVADPRFIENILSGSLNCGGVFDGYRISNKF